MKKVSLLALTVISAVILCSCSNNTGDENLQTSDQLELTVQTDQSVQTSQITEEATQQETEAVELAEYDINKVLSYEYYSEYSGLDFLSEEQQRVFSLASFVYETFDLDLSDFFRSAGTELTEDNHIEDTIFYHTGFTYESVMKGFSSVLSEDILKGLTEQKCVDINGEFVCGAGARGGNMSYMGTIEFEPVEVTDDIVKFKGKAGYGDPENPDEILSYEEYDFEMEKVNGRWIVTKFKLWY